MNGDCGRLRLRRESRIGDGRKNETVRSRPGCGRRQGRTETNWARALPVAWRFLCILAASREAAMAEMNRREMLIGSATAVAAGMLGSEDSIAAAGQAGSIRQRARAQNPRKVIVAGGGIGGLCCAYELMMRGHEVVLFEASGRTGGHVKTIHDPLADGLYADVGAEHFTKPGYDLYWGYVR